MNKAHHIGVTLRQATRSCGVNDPTHKNYRKIFRFEKLKFRRGIHTSRLSGLHNWINPITAPPAFKVKCSIPGVILPQYKDKI